MGKNKKWTKEEEVVLFNNTPITKDNLKYLSEILVGRNKNSIKQHSLKLGIFKTKDIFKFTEEQDETIKQNFKTMDLKIFAKKWKVKEYQIRNRAHTLGIKKDAQEFWTDEDVETLIKYYGKISNDELRLKLKRINKTDSALCSKASALKLCEDHWWTEQEFSILKKHYYDGDKDFILKNLNNRSWDNVINQANKNGLTRKREYPIWEEYEDNIIKNNWGKLEDFQLVDLLINRTHRAIKARRQDLGLYRKVGNTIGTKTTSKNGDICHSFDECKIINYVYEKGVRYRKDVPYSELIKNDSTNRTCDICIYLDNDIYAIEYFGIYRKTPRNKMEKDYVEKMAYKYDSFIYRANNNVIFIPIYPDDVGQRDSRKMKRTIDEIIKKEI